MAQERRFIECDRCGSGTGTPEEGDGKRGLREEVAAAVPTVCAGYQAMRVCDAADHAPDRKSWDAWKAWAKLEEVPGES